MRIILRSIFSLTIFSSMKKSTTEILSETRSFLETSKKISTFVIGIKNLERRISRRKNPSNAATTIRVENSQKKKKKLSITASILERAPRKRRRNRRTAASIREWRFDRRGRTPRMRGRGGSRSQIHGSTCQRALRILPVEGWRGLRLTSINHCCVLRATTCPWLATTLAAYHING